jgi:2,4-dienoyl-CoA reductase-like NADH-dependent reductase (Old Yellow Enzyme family)
MTAAPFDAVPFPVGPAMKNRFMLAPLTNCQSNADGSLSDAEIHWLTMRATGGFGLTMTAAATVQKRGQGFAGQLGVFADDQLPGLTRLASGLNEAGTVSYVQLHHAGNRTPVGLTGDDVVSVSDDPATGARALTTAEVEQTIQDFVDGAVRSQKAGFHGVELHGAHGYLICQFLSPEMNVRTDRYGGSLENRSRFLFEIVEGVRRACPGLALGVRLSPERFGMQIPEICEVYERLVGMGVDLIDMSLWDVFKMPVDEQQGSLAGKNLTEIFAGIPRGNTRLGVAGKIHDPADVQRVLDLGVDIAVLGRVAILHHDYPNLMAGGEFVPRRPPAAPEVLLAEGLSGSFVEYMRTSFKGFVAD